MNFRVTDSKTNADLTARIGAQRSRLDLLQERITTGKRINRPSDDPAGAEAVLTIRTSQKELEQFQRNAQSVNTKLSIANGALENYQNTFDRIRSLVSQGLSDTTTQESKNVMATELEGIRAKILNIANSSSNGEYIFGGTRQNVPPFDPTTAAPAAAPTAAQFIQIEPGANPVAAGVTANTIFADSTSDIFTDLNSLINALRGTGDAAADRATLQNTNVRLGVYKDLASIAQTKVGANMSLSETVQENLGNNFLSLDERAGDIENADFASTALEYTNAQRGFEATLQVASQTRRSLFDFLG